MTPITGVITAVTASALEAKAAVNGYSYENGTLVAGTAGYSCAADAAVFYKDEDGNYVKGTIADYASDDNDTIYVVTKGTTGTNATTVDYIYIQYVDDGNVGITFYSNNACTTEIAQTSNAISVSSGSNVYAKVSGVNVVVKNGSSAVSPTSGVYTFSSISATTTITVTAVDGSVGTYTINIA